QRDQASVAAVGDHSDRGSQRVLVRLALLGVAQDLARSTPLALRLDLDLVHLDLGVRRAIRLLADDVGERGGVLAAELVDLALNRLRHLPGRGARAGRLIPARGRLLLDVLRDGRGRVARAVRATASIRGAGTETRQGGDSTCENEFPHVRNS